MLEVSRSKSASEADSWGLVARKEGDWENMMFETAQVYENGLSVIVLPPMPQKIAKGFSGFAVEELLVRIRVTQNLGIESTKMSAIALAEQLSRELNGKAVRTPFWSGVLMLPKQHPWSEQADGEKSGQYSIEIRFIAEGTLPDSPDNQDVNKK